MDKTQLPKVTIGIVVYNGEDFLRETLQTLVAQEYSNFHILISDNCSDDATAEIAEEFSQKYDFVDYRRHESNIGFSGNLNSILSDSDSPYVCLFHADDLYSPSLVSKQVSFLEQNTNAVAVFSLGTTVDADGRPLRQQFMYNHRNVSADRSIAHEEFLRDLIRWGGSGLICSSVMVRRDAALAVGGFSTEIKYVEDQDMWLRLLERGDIGLLAKNLVRYRIHAGQGSSVYLDRKRTNVSIPIKHILDYCETRGLEGALQDELNDLRARDALRRSVNHLRIRHLENAYSFCMESLRFKRFGIVSRFGIYQRVAGLLLGLGRTPK